MGMPPLWLALSIPALPLTVFERALPAELPLAIRSEQHIVAVNASAAAAGIRPGMSTTLALSLHPPLRLHARDPEAERQALQRLADWALQFTSWLSLQPPDGLLLEIAGSLNLFGGLDKLTELLRQKLELLGYQGRLAIAPTPTGAWLLNRAGDERPVQDLHTLRQRLEQLPCSVLELDERQRQALQGLGINNLGQCLRLPRAGLARRLGPALLARLDKALGQAPDPRRPHQPSPRFQARIELPAIVEQAESLLFVLRRLLQELSGFLRGRDAGIQQLLISLENTERGQQCLRLGLRRPTRDPERLLMLARERLAQTPLQAPVQALAVSADDLLPFDPATPDLLSLDKPSGTDNDLLERFSARLGADAVTGIRTLPDHRPERAWGYSPPGTVCPPADKLPRPLWLLPQPQLLTVRDGRPCWHGTLVLHAGPERIESGWWDDGDISRDYYIAHNPRGQRLWIFRERRSRNWYVHGFFA